MYRCLGSGFRLPVSCQSRTAVCHPHLYACGVTDTRWRNQRAAYMLLWSTPSELPTAREVSQLRVWRLSHFPFSINYDNSSLSCNPGNDKQQQQPDQLPSVPGEKPPVFLIMAHEIRQLPLAYPCCQISSLCSHSSATDIYRPPPQPSQSHFLSPSASSASLLPPLMKTTS